MIVNGVNDHRFDDLILTDNIRYADSKVISCVGCEHKSSVNAKRNLQPRKYLLVQWFQ